MSTFPLNLLPNSIKDAIVAQAAMGDYPIEAVGPAALAVVSFATQALANVDALHSPGVACPLSNLFMVLARSGDAKSSLFNRLMSGVYSWQDRQLEVYHNETIAYQADKKIHEAERVKAEKGGDRDGLIRVMKDCPKVPADPRNILSKTTTNGIYSTLERGWPTVGLFTSEGGSMLAGHSLRRENSPAEFASMMTLLWDGAPIDRTTGDVTLRLKGRRMAGLVMVQPEVASAFLNDPVLKTQGLHARFLIATPPPWVPREVDFNSDAETERLSRLATTLKPFAFRVEELLSAPLNVQGEDGRELKPVTIGWDVDARTHLGEWYNRVGLKWRKEETETFFGRALEHAQRLAGAMTVFDQWNDLSGMLAPDTDLDGKLAYYRDYTAPVMPVIGLGAAQAATALVEWFAEQLLAIDTPVTNERDTSQADYIDRIRKYMRKMDKPVTAREIPRGPMQRVNSSVRDAVLESMVRDEYLEQFEITSNGSMKTVAYKIK